MFSETASRACCGSSTSASAVGICRNGRQFSRQMEYCRVWRMVKNLRWKRFRFCHCEHPYSGVIGRAELSKFYGQFGSNIIACLSLLAVT